VDFHNVCAICAQSVIFSKHVGFHLRAILRNMTSICLLSLKLRKNRSKNVIEYVPGKSPLEKNLTRQKWNLKDGVEVHVIYNFYCFYMSQIQ